VQRVETMEVRGAVGLRLSAWLQRTPRRGSVPVGWRSVGPVRTGWGRGEPGRRSSLGGTRRDDNVG
jgi:hypothetical protein